MAPASYDAPVLPDGRRLGAHLPLATGMVKAVERAHEIGATALQVFGDNPTAWRRRAEPPTELPAFRERLAALDIGPVAIHASYLINLAGPEPDFRERSIGLLTSELQAAPGFEARSVNVHIGSHRDTSVAAGTTRLADAVARVLAEVDDTPKAARLVLENSSGSGFGLGTSVTELADIAEAIAARGVAERRVGFCLDTAHAWGAGVDLSTRTAWTASSPRSTNASDSTGWSWSISTTPSPSAAPAPIAMNTSGPGASAPRGSRGSSPTPLSRGRRITSRPLGWTRGTTRSTWRGRTTWRRADRSPSSAGGDDDARQQGADGSGRARRPPEPLRDAGDPLRRPGAMADGVALVVLLALAGLMRLPDLASRGTWDADQGHDMLVLRALVPTGSSRSSGHRRRSATSTMAPSTTTSWPRPRR